MTATFLKGRWGWVDSDECWWRKRGRWTREHPFKECAAWTKEIRTLRKEVGDVSGKSNNRMPGRGAGHPRGSGSQYGRPGQGRVTLP